MDDLISRKAAINFFLAEGMPTAAVYIERMPPAQPERLTDDDFETIRIHLNAYKENLCNQQRWKEAEEYQRIIDRFMTFATAQPEVKTISYTECANAMLKMWIDNVLTDGEYNRIMDKLNAHWIKYLQ